MFHLRRISIKFGIEGYINLESSESAFESYL
jgi:hypothetical protein